jgi:hypothetical protein
MYPKTIYGWYNSIIRGYSYNEKTAYMLDHTFKPNARLISTLEDKKHREKSSSKISINRIFQK